MDARALLRSAGPAPSLSRLRRACRAPPALDAWLRSAQNDDDGDDGIRALVGFDDDAESDDDDDDDDDIENETLTLATSGAPLE